MKDHCVMCLTALKADKPEKYYRIYGNFCLQCTVELNKLTVARPYEDFIVSIEEFQKMHPVKKRWYTQKLERFWKKKKVYNKLSKKYQDSLKDVK